MKFSKEKRNKYQQLYVFANVERWHKGEAEADGVDDVEEPEGKADDGGGDEVGWESARG